MSRLKWIPGDGKLPSGTTARIRRELSGLRTLIDIELQLEHLDFDNRWDFAAPMHLIKELLKGRPTANQRDVYTMFRQVWNDFGKAYPEPDAECVTTIYNSLAYLNLKGAADRFHLAQAIAVEATWFLTNDNDIIEKTSLESERLRYKATGIRENVGIIQSVRIALPSECATRLAFHPVWGLMSRGSDRASST